MQRHRGNETVFCFFSEKGIGESPSSADSVSHFQAAREDRVGCSRYRAAKMSLFGIIRVVPRLASPLCLGWGVFVLEFL